MVGLGFPSPLSETIPFAVADGGLAVVGSSYVLGVSGDAFVWTEGRGMELLQGVLEDRFGLSAALFNWNLTSAADISADGRFIVGDGINLDGNQEGWLVRLDQPIFVPEPTSLCLISILLAGTTCKHRRAS